MKLLFLFKPGKSTSAFLWKKYGLLSTNLLGFFFPTGIPILETPSDTTNIASVSTSIEVLVKLSMRGSVL